MPTLATTVASIGNPNLSAWVYDLPRHASETFSGLLTANSLRLVAIVGGYLLLRPHLFRLVSRHQASQLPQGAHVPDALLNAGSQESEDDKYDEAVWGLARAEDTTCYHEKRRSPRVEYRS